MAVDIVDCPVCGGWGFDVVASDNGDGPDLYAVSCSHCDGTGHIEILTEED